MPNPCTRLHSIQSHHRLHVSLQTPNSAKLIPGLRKDGYTEEPDSNVAGSNLHALTIRNLPVQDHRNRARSRLLPIQYPPENPLSVGRSDLDPSQV